MCAHSLDDFEATLDMLRGAAARWAKGEAVEETAAIFRKAALLHNHAHYVEQIPAYRELASQRDLDRAATIAEISSELMFTTSVFKSYDRRWLETGDYDRLTAWLDRVYAGAAVADLGRVSSVEEWRRALADRSVFVTCSSGTSGKLSFVPRDRATLEALSSNGWFYAHAVPAMTVVERGDFDCLVVGPRATGTGIQAASLGVSRAASRSHFVFGRDADSDHPTGPRDVSYAAAREFLASATSAGRPVVLFGTPLELYRACAWLVHEGRTLQLADGSIAITGGGWKSATTALDHEQLSEHVERALGLAPDHVIDTYSTAETSFFCLRCRAGRYHVPPFVDVVRLDEALTPMPGADGFGIIGFLDPFAFSYPGFLITGDVGYTTFGPCPCGLSGWAIW
jgi:hypothetical protein